MTTGLKMHTNSDVYPIIKIAAARFTMPNSHLYQQKRGTSIISFQWEKHAQFNPSCIMSVLASEPWSTWQAKWQLTLTLNVTLQAASSIWCYLHTSAGGDWTLKKRSEKKRREGTCPIIYFNASFNLHFPAQLIKPDREHKDADTVISGGRQRSAFNLSKAQYLLE